MKKYDLLNILNEVLNEVGDLKNIQSYPYSLTNNGGEFEIEFDGISTKTTVGFDKWPDTMKKYFSFPPIVDIENKTIINIGFTIGGSDSQFQITNISLLLKVIKTVGDIIIDSIHKFDKLNPVFALFASDKKGVGFNDSQKMGFYKLVLSQNIPTGWRIGEGTYRDTTKLIFFTK